jgi:uncharacterized membrane protein AbrB (regulator of aidB expression)
MPLLVWSALGLVNYLLSIKPTMPTWSYAVLGFIYGSNFGMQLLKSARKEKPCR